MTPYTVTNESTESMATFVDETFGGAWSEAAAMLMTLAVGDCGLSAVAPVSLGHDPVHALRSTPSVLCLAACLTSLGSATRLDVALRI